MAGAVERKLTTIMCADVSGYARLMGADEAGTLATLKLYRDAMVGLIERQRGRLVSTSGDSLLAEFRSVVEAVQCAVEIQRELANRNRSVPDALRMEFRIGINLGDVMVEGGDLYGEGVNVAARLEALAEPGRYLHLGHGLRSGPQPADARLRFHRRATGEEHLRAGTGLSGAARWRRCA
jgi:adenylate cyclase